MRERRNGQASAISLWDGSKDAGRIESDEGNKDPNHVTREGSYSLCRRQESDSGPSQLFLLLVLAYGSEGSI